MTKETNKQPSKRRPREKPTFTEAEENVVDALDHIIGILRRLKRLYSSLHMYPFSNTQDSEPGVEEIVAQYKATIILDMLKYIAELQDDYLEALKHRLLNASAVPPDFDNLVSAILPGDAFEDDQCDEDEDDFDPV